MIASLALGFMLAITLVVDYFGEPPTYLTGLLGTAAGAFFTALGSDRAKRDADVAQTADRAETTAKRAEDKADTLGRVAAHEHPEVKNAITPPFDPDDIEPQNGYGGDR